MADNMEGDTFKDTYVESGLPRACRPDMGAPDDRGFGAGIPSHAFATGPVVLTENGLSTRASGPTGFGSIRAGDPAPAEEA